MSYNSIYYFVLKPHPLLGLDLERRSPSVFPGVPVNPRRPTYRSRMTMRPTSCSGSHMSSDWVRAMMSSLDHSRGSSYLDVTLGGNALHSYCCALFHVEVERPAGESCNFARSPKLVRNGGIVFKHVLCQFQNHRFLVTLYEGSFPFAFVWTTTRVCDDVNST